MFEIPPPLLRALAFGYYFEEKKAKTNDINKTCARLKSFCETKFIVYILRFAIKLASIVFWSALFLFFLSLLFFQLQIGQTEAYDWKVSHSKNIYCYWWPFYPFTGSSFSRSICFFRSSHSSVTYLSYLSDFIGTDRLSVFRIDCHFITHSPQFITMFCCPLAVFLSHNVQASISSPSFEKKEHFPD